MITDPLTINWSIMVSCVQKEVQIRKSLVRNPVGNRVNEENNFILTLLSFKTTHPDQDKTETRLCKIKANEMRPRRDCLRNFHPR